MAFFYSKIPFLKEGPLTHYSLRVPDIPKNHLSKVTAPEPKLSIYCEMCAVPLKSHSKLFLI